VNNLQVMADGARGNQAVHRRADGKPVAPGDTIKLNGLLEYLKPQWTFDHRKTQHGVPRSSKGGLVAKSLQDLLHDRRTGHNIVKVDKRQDIKRAYPPKDFDPN